MDVRCEANGSAVPKCGGPSYTALIRTFNSEKTLRATVEALLRQTIPPGQFVFVDSGSKDGTLHCVPEGSRIRHFCGTEFSFSEALNQGLQDVETECVLVISSHTSLARPDAIEYALRLLSEDESLGAAYFCHENSGRLQYARIDKESFDGFNGLWNTCAIIRMEWLRRRGFNPEVFIAEDQEWAKWLFEVHGRAIARISGGGLTIRNERPNRRQKRLNEYVAIAYFVNRRLLGIRNLAVIACRAFAPLPLRRFEERRFWLVLMWRLLLCRFIRPRYRSRYFDDKTVSRLNPDAASQC